MSSLGYRQQREQHDKSIDIEVEPWLECDRTKKKSSLGDGAEFGVGERVMFSLEGLTG